MRIAGVPCAALFLMACVASGCSDDQAPTAPTPAFTPPPSIPTGLSAPLTQMLNGLAAYITSVTAENQALLPNNQQSRVYIESKIASLKTPTLFADIINGRRWQEGVASSTIGPAVPIATVFMLEPMRAEAADTIRTIEAALPLLEAFLNVRYPGGTVRIWYGFKVGNSGGGGVIYTEDRTTYVTRTTASRKPFDAIEMHELSHSYIGNECLNQFLEHYLFNLIATGSEDFARWTYTENTIPGVAALFEIYQLIGHDAMRDAYRAVYPLRPPYGSPLSQPVIQAFLTAVPSEHQATVTARLGAITF
jgi:hypothetical protein